MQEIIDEKLNELKSLGAVSRELREWVEKSNLWYWIYSYFEMDGAPLERSKIVDILDGKIVENAPLEAYRLILGFQDVYKDMRSCAEMGQEADVRLLLRWGEELLGRPVEFRKGSPVVYEWNHIPPVAAECEDKTVKLLRVYASKHRETPSVRLMAKTYLEHLRLYAFDRDTITMAWLFLMYALLRDGYPLPGPSLSDTELNGLIDNYVNKGDAEGFTVILQRSVLNRLDSVLQLSKQAAEIHDK